MQLYEMQVTKTAIYRTAPAKIPSRIVGAVVRFRFSPEWEGLSKTVVFRAGDVTKDVLGVEELAVIPAECTQEVGALLEVGVYGVDEENTAAIPTLWATIGRVCEAADPSGDETTDPSLPVWAQLLDRIHQLEEQGVTQNEVEQAVRDFFGGELPAGRTTPEGGEIFNFYTGEVITGDGKVYPGNTANKGAHARNFGTHADGEYSSAEGWNSSATGGISDAGGRETEAGGYCAVSRGWGTKASGSCSDAGGRDTEASGPNTVARGIKTKATNTASVAMGEETEASGYCASAHGYKTKAIGTASRTNGRETEARQYASSADGRGTIATARNQHVQGAWNVADVPDANGNGTYAHIVGGGTSDTNRKNIHTLDWSGNAEFAGKVYSGGVELAPGGFGLGKDVGAGCADCNTAIKNGWYVTSAGTLNCPAVGGQAMNYCMFFVQARYAKVHQTYWVCVNGIYGRLQRYSMDSGATWSEWEWVNPPMSEGVEYRTTERYNGYPVYTKLIEYGAVTNGASLEAPYNIIRYAAKLNGWYLLPFSNGTSDFSGSFAARLDVTNGNVRYYGGSSVDGKDLTVQFWYT